MRSPHADPFDLTASYADMDGARKAIDALEFHGIDPSRIRLLGAAADAARRADERPNMARRDLRLAWRLIWRAVLWSLIGAAAGAVAGVGFWLAGFVVINPWFTVLMWALFGHLTGGMWGAYAALSIGDAWEMTFERVDGMPVVVAVRVDGAAAAAHAERILRASAPQGVALTPAHGASAS